MSILLNGLNPAQREAVTHKLGPLLIIAGPGSGKTRTVVHSIAYAIENGVPPDRILAFSFTVKASKELKNRVNGIVGEKGNRVNISTFHKFCRKVLREDIDKLGVGHSRDFIALEENDQKRIVKGLTRAEEQRVRVEIEDIQSHQFPNPDKILDFIKKCKAREISPSNSGSYVPDFNMSEDYIKIYESYEKTLKTEGWIDYESQQLFTNAIFRDVPEVKTRWQEKFDLIFVDEYQDTDPVQYQIINALAEKHENLRVVGDDDQGIYGWRGADIQNILDFEKDYPNAKVISLGQNYRSTQSIVETSRALADFNPDHREKELFTRNHDGEKVKYLHCENNEEEAAIIAAFIQRSVDKGNWQPKDFALLYRTKNQAHVFRTALSNLEIQCQIVNNSLDTDTTGVTIMTIHKSKGLEFPIVFVTGICKDLLPFYYNRDEKEWPEELRLLYVAMTRAKNWLCLSFYETEVGSQYVRGQSPFLRNNYIPTNLLESLETLENVSVPTNSPEIAEEILEYVEPIPEKLLGNGMTVLGIDPGIQNVGWSITKKSPDGYTVLKYGTQTTTGWQNTLVKTKSTINNLIEVYCPDAIAVEKIEIGREATREDWFLYVAGCVATIKSIAHQHGIECCLYTPQHVKEAATDKRNASKQEVQKGVMRICNLNSIPEPHHSADAIAASLCYLRSYLNSSRFEGNKRKMERYETGCDYIDKRQFDEAIDEFKETLYIDPIFTDVYVSMGRAHLAQNKIQAAENAAEKALRLKDNFYPDSQKLLDAIRKYRSGCSSLENSEWNIAIDNFKESINQEPIFTEAHCGLSQAYLNAGNLEAARNAAVEALKLRNDYPPARKLLYDVKMKSYDIGRTYFNHGEYDQAIIELQRAVKIDADFKAAYLYLGRTHLKLGDLETAEKEAREALRVDSTYEFASQLLGEIKRKYKEQGDVHQKRNAYSEALKSYKHAIRIDDRYKNAYNCLGIVYLKMKEYSKAIRAYQHAINIDENCHEVHTNLSIVYHNISQFTKAISSLKRAITIKSDYQVAHYYLASSYFKMENLPNASETVLKAIGLDANDQNTLELLKNIQNTYLKQGHDYLKQDELAAAENEARKALRLDANYEPVSSLLSSIKEEYYKRGLASLEQNEWKSAEKFAEEALRMDPNYQNASDLQKQTYYEKGIDHIKNNRYVKGINELQKANDIDPNCEKTHYYLGRTFFKLKRLKDAQLSVKQALSIRPYYLQASELLSEINHPRNWLKLGVANVRHFTHRILKLNQD